MHTEHLYHYTGPAALLNILNHGYLRATQAWHLADGSECRHAIDTLRLIEPALGNNGLWKSLEERLLSMPRYVVCFSKVRNDSYQWKNYGADGAGACIVFNPEKAFTNILNSSWDRFECQYDQERQRRQLEELAKDLNERKDTAVAERMHEFWQWNIQFKREKFSRENEVRFVFSAQPQVEDVAVQHTDFVATQLATEITNRFNSFSHPSGCFDEKCRPFEPFYIQEAIVEIILGPRFTAIRKY